MAKINHERLEKIHVKIGGFANIDYKHLSDTEAIYYVYNYGIIHNRDLAIKTLRVMKTLAGYSVTHDVYIDKLLDKTNNTLQFVEVTYSNQRAINDAIDIMNEMGEK